MSKTGKVPPGVAWRRGPATVGEGGTVAMKRVVIERDTRRTLQVSTGLDGSAVEIIAPTAPAASKL